MTTNRKLARLGAVTAALAGLGAAAMVPLAGSASAATVSPTVTAATSYRLVALLPFRGYGYAGDYQKCENLAVPYQKLFPQDVIFCSAPEYDGINATASDNYDPWTSWFYEYVPS